MSDMPPISETTPPESPRRHRAADALRTYLITGLLALAPSAITLWVLYKLLNWTDNLLGRYLKFEVLGNHRIPGAGLVATFLLLLLVGWLATMIGRWLGGKPLLRMWDHLLNRIPGVGLLYGSTKSFGEAFFTERKSTFKQVVLVPWPHPGIYRIGFIAASAGEVVRDKLGEDVAVVFVPHTPNPASGFVHYVPRAQLILLDWTVEDGLKVVVSGGVLQPGSASARAAGARAGSPTAARAAAAVAAEEAPGGPRP